MSVSSKLTILDSGPYAGESIERIVLTHLGHFLSLVHNCQCAAGRDEKPWYYDSLRELDMLVNTPQPQVVPRCVVCAGKATHIIVYRGVRLPLNKTYVLCSKHAQHKSEVIKHIGRVFDFLSIAAEIFPLSLKGTARIARYANRSYLEAVEFLYDLCNFPSELSDDNVWRFLHGEEPDPPRRKYLPTD